MTRVGWHPQLFASLARTTPSTSDGYRRCGIALLLNTRITGGSSDATAGSTMQALSCTG
jgi:hypothetical protein